MSFTVSHVVSPPCLQELSLGGDRVAGVTVSPVSDDGTGLTMTIPLRISVLGDAGVWLGADRLVFLTHRAELAVFCLAIAGPAGLHREVLVERLWPGAPADRGRQRLRTLLWQVRVALGDEAWRLSRHHQIIRLNLNEATFDLADARDQARALLRARPLDVAAAQTVALRLTQPLLVGWQFETWVEDERDLNAELVLALAEGKKHAF